MVIYPVPVEVTQARIQLVIDQNAKAPPKTISDDLQAVYHSKAAAEQAALAETSPDPAPAPAADADADADADVKPDLKVKIDVKV